MVHMSNIKNAHLYSFQPTSTICIGMYWSTAAVMGKFPGASTEQKLRVGLVDTVMETLEWMRKGRLHGE